LSRPPLPETAGAVRRLISYQGNHVRTRFSPSTLHVTNWIASPAREHRS